MGRYRNSSAILFSVFFAVLTIPAGIFAEGSENTINNESFVSNGGMFIASYPSAYISNPRITSGPAISTIDPVTASATLKDSFPNEWIMLPTGLDLLKTYEIRYRVRLNYLYGVCPICWWADFSPVKEKTFTHSLSITREGLDYFSTLYVYRSEYGTTETYNYNSIYPEAGENWAENLMNNLNDVAFADLITDYSGLKYAVTITAHGYGKGVMGGTLINYDTLWVNSGANPLVITVTQPPDPDLKYGGTRSYKVDGTWYSFSTPIKIKNGQSKNIDFYATNIGSGPSSNEGYVSISISNNLDISDSGSGYWSASYPPGSQLGGKCQVPSSTYKLLDTWTKYDASQSRYIYTKLTGKSLGDGWIKVRADFDTPANGLNTMDDPRAGETSEQDQQCFPAYKIPVIVGECFADSDCGSDGYIGSPVCSNDDVLQTFRHYACNANYRCEYTEFNNVIQDCGDDYCDAWQNAYCENGNQLWHNRECYDRGCSDSTCFNKKFTQAQKIQDCPGQTEPWSGPYCASGQVVHSRGLYDGWCAGLTPARCDYKLRTNEVEVVDGCADYCEGWSANYCKGENVYRNRTCHDKGCNTGDIKCYDNVNIQEEMVINCGSSGYGPGYCYDNDVYRDYQTNGCSAGSCYSSSQTEKMTECGSDSCDAWGSNYCKDDDVYHKRTCHSRGCSANSCFDNTYADEQKVQDCPSYWMTCSNGQCVAICTDECSAGQTRCSENYRQGCGNYDADSCLEWGGDFDCGTSYCGNWSANYCKSGDVYQNRTCYSRGCSSGACYDTASMEEQQVQICPNGCFGGACNSSSLSGDANGDCKVDIFDLAAVGLAYGSKPGGSNWNMNADFNKNNVVDIFDLAAVGLNYGRSC